MKSITIFTGLLFISSLSFSQIYEIGGFVGGSNFIGDVGSTQFVNPNKLALEVYLNGIEVLDIP